jgi:S-disulfanyl-L-cysteine oxidoreductase SoxD
MNRIAILASAVLAVGFASMAGQARRYNLGRRATPEEISKRDISVAPDGTGLPVGHGTVEQGRYIYKVLCAVCHGDRGQGVGDYPPLAGGQGTLKSNGPVLTVGSYWPYATTIWDYTHRAMPYQRPGTLSADETYALTAFILHMNGIVKENAELNEKTLPQIRMPNRDGFVPDPRPDVPSTQCKK